MSEMARKRRWERFVDRKSGKALVIPLDHGLTMGPIPGLIHPSDVLRWLDPDYVTGIVAHKGLIERLGGVPGCGLMVHLNGALTVDETPDVKQLLTTVDAAIRLGADAVSIQTNFSASTAGANLRLIGHVVDQAHALGMPVLAMVYDKTTSSGNGDMTHLRHFMRASVELGVDAIKVVPPADFERIPELVDGVQEHTPVLFAGGALVDEASLLALATAVVHYGTGGICVGRNVFQRADPGRIIARVVRRFRGEVLPDTEYRMPESAVAVVEA